MPLYRPSELMAFLSSIGATPKKSLSQNFLVDGNILSKIVAEVPKGSSVLEIGPGPGVLTEGLLEAGHAVVAVEKDGLFARALHRLEGEGRRLTVVEADILDCPIAPEGSVLVSNVPYHITTPILEWLLKIPHPFSKAILMVQREAARRLMGDSSSMVGVLLRCCYEVRQLFLVPRTCFWPKPEVDSVVLCFEERRGIENEQQLQTIIRSAFAHKRKTIRNSLEVLFTKGDVEKALQEIGVPAAVRPEEMTIQQWMRLTAFLEESARNLRSPSQSPESLPKTDQ